MPLPEPAHSRLAELGRCETSMQVADRMREAGIKGYPTEPCWCPIARCLSGGTDAPEIIVSSDYARVRWGGFKTEDDYEPLPPAVAAFVELFDKEFYPDLIEQ